MPKVKRQFKNIFKKSDAKGNVLLVEEEPTYGNRKVYIHLTTEGYPRLIGEIDRNNKVIFMERNKQKHFMWSMRAYGFNWFVINKTDQFVNVLLRESDGDDDTWYLIPVEKIKELGTTKNFGEQGFELQTFLRIEYMENYKTDKRFEKNRLTG